MSEVFFWLVLIALWLAAHVAVGASLVPWWKKWWKPSDFDIECDKGFVIFLWPFMVFWLPFKLLIGLAVMSAEDREKKRIEAEKRRAYVDPEETEAKRKARAEWEAFYDASVKEK